MTNHKDLFAALAAPFEPGEVKSRTQAGRQFHYVTARTVMNRLDEVLGPENWWDEYHAAENSVLCKLTVRLPDGVLLTKQDAGGYAGMADSGDDDKSGYSDAFKRAAVKFGTGRYLYKDGVPHFAMESPSPAPPANGSGKGRQDDRAYAKLVADAAAKLMVHAAQLNTQILRDAVESDLVPLEEAQAASAKGSANEIVLMTEVYGKHRQWVRDWLKARFEDAQAAHAQ